MTFLHQLRTAPTRDLPARNAALVAVDTMLKGGSRSTALLAQATAAAQNATLTPAMRIQRASALANAAYTNRINAEVAKHRAAYLLMAEENGNAAATWGDAMARVDNARAKAVAIEKVKYFQTRRDLMVQAAQATAEASRYAMPLPNFSPSQATSEILARGDSGWRPRAPCPVTSGLRGLSAGATPQLPLGDTDWWASVKNVFGQGIKATGEAAAVEGQKAAGASPAGGVALNASGQLLAKLSTMLGLAEEGKGAAAVTPEVASTFPWGLVLGGVAVLAGGVVAYKFFRKG